MSNNIEEDIKIVKVNLFKIQKETCFQIRVSIENILADREEKEKYISEIANMLGIAEDQIPIELASQLAKANKYDNLIDKLKVYCEDNIKRVNCGEALSIREILKDILELLDTEQEDK